MTLGPGASFGPYEIRDRLGAGGMGEVYLAWDTRLRREVALKILPAGAPTGDGPRHRLLAEARLGARVDHPNVCAIYEVGQHDGRDFIAMQRVPGATLEARLTHPIPEGEALAIATQVADAVAAAHAQGVIHRDLKALNIMITPDERAVVLDFGIARTEEPTFDGSTVTGTGLIAGTPSSMSPEQARGEPLDARTDVFSFGALLWRMRTGHDPFAAHTAADSIAAVLRHEPEPLTAAAPGTNPEFARIVRKCLEKDRGLRYRSMGEVRVDLERLKQGANAPQAWAPRKSTVWWGLSLLLLAVAAAGVFVWHPWRPAATVRTLAVLPFRSLGPEAKESYLGLGIADAVISRVSQDPDLVVRPTSAIRKYATGDADLKEAARELGVDAVLEGTWQREGDRLRVTANLLRPSDGASLWSDRFDASSADLFSIQDRISDQLAERLQTRLAGAGRPAATSGGTRDSKAYEAYAKAIYYFSERGYNAAQRGNSDQATRLFAEAIRLDPGFARAHAQLAFAYVWTALFIDQDATLIERARPELAEAERLEPNLALVPLVRSQVLFSRYGGWRMQDAITQLRRAEELEPGIAELERADLAMHLGLEKPWREGMDRALQKDPLNQRLRWTYVHNAYLLALPELGRKLQKDLLGEEPDARYWAEVFDVSRTLPELERSARETPDDPLALIDLASGRALQGRCDEADALVGRHASRLTRDRHYHHMTYEIVQTYAYCGNAEEAVRWLEETVAWGNPALPMFERDPYLERIRESREFASFVARLRPVWERDRDALLRVVRSTEATPAGSTSSSSK